MNKLAFGLAAGLMLAAAPAYAFQVSSPAVGKDRKLPDKYAGSNCSGQNISFPIAWKALPKDTKSIAVTVYDRDAPTGSGFWHWVVANIPPATTELAEGAGAADGSKLPAGAVQARNDASQAAYTGPCPPAGKPHRYAVTVYALKTGKVNVDANTSGAAAGFALHANLIRKVTAIYTYGRK